MSDFWRLSLLRNPKIYRAAISIATCAALFAAHDSHAQSVTYSDGSTQANDQAAIGFSGPGPHAVQSIYIDPTTGNSSVATSDTNGTYGNAAVSASAGALEYGLVYSRANLSYQFEVNGASGPSVPVIVTSLLDGFLQNGNIQNGYPGGCSIVDYPNCPFSQAQVYITDGNSIDDSKALTLEGAMNNDLYIWKDAIAVPVGDVVTISMYVVAQTEYAETTANASADPYIQIDPAFLSSNPGYSLVISDGVGNSPFGVPEPATWTLVLAGLGWTGAAMRDQRRRMTTSAG